MRIGLAVLIGGLVTLADAAHAGGWRLAGAEFNPVRSMPRMTSPGSARDQSVRWLSLSGTARIAADPRHDEITIPLAWSARRGESDVDLLAFEFDVQYRRFLSRSNHGGAYAGPLLRVAHRRGELRRSTVSATRERLGVGLVLGFRLPMATDHHWDLSFSHGRFLGAGSTSGSAGRAVAATAIADVFTDRAVLRLVRRF